MKLYVRDEIDEIDQEVKNCLKLFRRSWKRMCIRICPALPISRKPSQLRWRIMWEHILKCSAVTEGRLFDIRKRMNTCPLGAREHLQELPIRWTENTPHSFSALMHQPETVWIPYLTEIM